MDASRMCARPDLPKIASNNRLTPTPDEAKAIAVGSLAIFGTYTVDEAKKTWSQRNEASTFANLVGTDTNFTVVSLTADELKQFGCRGRRPNRYNLKTRKIVVIQSALAGATGFRNQCPVHYAYVFSDVRNEHENPIHFTYVHTALPSTRATGRLCGRPTETAGFLPVLLKTARSPNSRISSGRCPQPHRAYL